MALIERLMGLAADGVSPSPDEQENPSQAKIPIHLFFAAQSEILAGRLTVANVRNYLLMDDACTAEYEALIATAPTGSTTDAKVNKRIFLDSIHSVFILAERRAPGYHTPAAVRSKLGL
jgi:hypothetical protein